MTIRERPRRSGQWAEDGSRRYVREFSVTDDDVLNAAQVMLMVGIPKLQDYYLPTDLYARCVGVDPEMEGDARHWKVRCTYSTKYPQPGAEDDNPLLRPADVRWSSVRASRVLPYDVNGQPFENVNGEPFQSPPPVIYSQARLVITRNEASFNPLLTLTYGNTKSSAIWYGIAAGYIGCEEITGESRWENDVAFASVTYSFLVDPYGFDQEILNTGTIYRAAAGGALQPCHVNGVLTSTPQKLAANGTLLAAGAAPVYVTRVVRASANYAALSL